MEGQGSGSMAAAVDGSGEGGGGLKKGPWTPAEDELLVGHVRRHGEGSWNAVRRETGLRRCGKSCRLRWANHLRPNLKRGPFSPDEERLILRLHKLIGNKWARISAHLPGRTDNEIKNYWNTRVKRRKRAGLHLYPLEIEREVALIRAGKLSPIVDADGNATADASLQATPPLLDTADPFAWPAPPPLQPFNNAAQELQLFHFTGTNLQTADAAAQLPYHHDGAGLDTGKYYDGALGLPPLPPTAQELPSNQSAPDAMGAAGLMVVLEQDQQLAGAALLRVGSMPELVCHENDIAWPSGDVFGSGSRSEGDITSHYGGKRDCFFDDAKPAKRRAASAAAEEEISDLFGCSGVAELAAWPDKSPIDPDDYFYLQMQQFVSSVPLSSDEHNWNPASPVEQNWNN